MASGGSLWRGANGPRLLALGLALIAVTRVVTVWSDLPPRMASHFDAGGRPNGWMSREGFFGIIAVVGGGTSVLLLLLPVLLTVLPPELINLPNRDYWLAEERRADTIARLGRLMAWLGFATAALIALVLELSIEANLREGALDNGAFMVGMGVYVLSVVLVLAKVVRSFRFPPGAS